MRSTRFRSRVFRGSVIAALMIAGVCEVSPGAAVSAGEPPQAHNGTSLSFSTAGKLGGIAAVSSKDAWAVGVSSAGRTLIVRWNGRVWARVPSPSLRTGGGLQAVAATSAKNAWAVGSTGARPSQPLILRWNGRSWGKVVSPTIAGGGYLNSVAASSSKNAWAVGYTVANKTLILRWNGSAWRRVASPSPAAGAALYGVAVASTGQAWAVGGTSTGNLIEGWDGASRVALPSPPSAATGLLTSVAIISASNAWAVGYGPGAATTTLILHWDGLTWAKVASPSSAKGSGLNDIVAASAKNAWAVGYTTVRKAPAALMLHWNGTAWKQARVSSPGRNGGLSGVVLSSSSPAWVVGTANYPASKAFILRPPAAGSAAQPPSPHTAIRRAPSQSGHVTVYGLVSCAFTWPVSDEWPTPLPGPWLLAQRVRFVTATGEGADATISNGISYSVTFNNVPSGGETAFAYIDCGVPNEFPSWGCQFTLNQQLLQVQYLDLLTHQNPGNVAPDC